VPGNARRGRPQGQCHREQTATPSETKRAVRVKGCGKSAPRDRQRERHGKPHREQNRIGMARALSSGRVQALSALPSGLVARGVRQRASQMNGRHARQLAYRTRLTGQLANFSFESPTTGRDPRVRAAGDHRTAPGFPPSRERADNREGSRNRRPPCLRKISQLPSGGRRDGRRPVGRQRASSARSREGGNALKHARAPGSRMVRPYRSRE
jgi:hypothetical protein